MIYFICTTNRSGSSWLCDMLRSTGVAGNPGEIKSDRNDGTAAQQEWADRIDTEDPCGVKLGMHLLKRLWPLTPRTPRPKFIWLRRFDTLRQAISQYRTKSGVWHWKKAKELPKAHREVPFDDQAIRRAHEWVRKHDARLKEWFSQHQVVPYILYYEQLEQTPVSCVSQILRFLNLPDDVSITTDQTKVLRDDITEAWVQRLLGEDKCRT